MKRIILILLGALVACTQPQQTAKWPPWPPTAPKPNPADWEEGITRTFVGDAVKPDNFQQWFFVVRLEKVHIQWMMKDGKSVLYVYIARVEPQCLGDGLGIYHTIDRASLNAIVSVGGSNLPVKIMEFSQGMKPVPPGTGSPREAYVEVPPHPTEIKLRMHGNCLDGTGPG